MTQMSVPQSTKERDDHEDVGVVTGSSGGWRNGVEIA
jgi:hypothetical protein